jgi:flagellin
MLSVNTNYSAMIALQNLNFTNTELEGVQNKISTGLKIGSARDNEIGRASCRERVS